MQIDDATRQATAPGTELDERISSMAVLGAEDCTAADGQTKAEGQRLCGMEAVVERHNLWQAYERVMRNKGAAGVDGLSVFEFKAWLQPHWPSVKTALLAGEYMPAAIRKVEIPKPNGGVRTLGIATVLDRLIQQALLQVLQPEFDPEFSEHSYGFRPGRNAWQAVQGAQGYIREGRRWVVEIADSSLKRLKDRVREIVVGNASRNLAATIAALNPVLRGWTSYFRLTEVKGVLEELDGWIRRKLRCLLWRQWKRPATRNKRLQARGLDKTRAWKSASNGRGPWWNAGASHMNAAYPKRFFDVSGLVSLLDTQRRFQRV